MVEPTKFFPDISNSLTIQFTSVTFARTGFFKDVYLTVRIEKETQKTHALNIEGVNQGWNSFLIFTLTSHAKIKTMGLTIELYTSGLSFGKVTSRLSRFTSGKNQATLKFLNSENNETATVIANYNLTHVLAPQSNDIFEQPIEKISKNGPHFVYSAHGTQTEESSSRIDYEEGWTSFKKYADDLKQTTFDYSSIFFCEKDKDYTDPTFVSILKDLRNLFRATKVGMPHLRDEDMQVQEIYISLGPVLKIDYSGLKIERYLKTNQYAFGWTQVDNENTYLASPITIEKLEDDVKSLKLSKQDEVTYQDDELINDGQKIYQEYQKVSEKFLNPDKRKFITVPDNIITDFTGEYHNKQSSTIDLTGLSARARIYILRKIINLKALWKDNKMYWTKEKGSLTLDDGTVITFDEWVDLLPTTIKIGKYDYKLENRSTKKQPGGGKLKGLRDLDFADTYKQILGWLMSYRSEMSKFKTYLLERQQGNRDEFIDPLSGDTTRLTGFSRFLNGLSLLFDFEVARRLIQGDTYIDLPVLPVIPYLLENFENIKLVSACFNTFFMKQKREGFVQGLILESRKDMNTQIQIRESLSIFHLASEDSEDEYTD